MTQYYDSQYQEKLSQRMQSVILDVLDFPKPGIVFKDVTPLLLDADLLSSLVKYVSSQIPPSTNKIAAIDARGFLIAAPVAVELRLPLAICRKPGKLPGETLSVSYELEYGTNELCVTKHSISQQDKIFILDDLLATGGTAKAAAQLCVEAGASVTGFGFLVELGFLNGRQCLDHANIVTVTNYASP